MRIDIPADVRALLVTERRHAIERANAIARLLGMPIVKGDRAPLTERWRTDDGEREPVPLDGGPRTC